MAKVKESIQALSKVRKSIWASTEIQTIKREGPLLSLLGGALCIIVFGVSLVWWVNDSFSDIKSLIHFHYKSSKFTIMDRLRPMDEGHHP